MNIIIYIYTPNNYTNYNYEQKITFYHFIAF